MGENFKIFDLYKFVCKIVKGFLLFIFTTSFSLYVIQIYLKAVFLGTGLF